MNKKERSDIDILKKDVGECRVLVQEILDNHLPHLNLKLNITLGGLIFIALMIAILGVIVTVVR